MGAMPTMSNSSFDCGNRNKAFPNPDPNNYNIIKYIEFNSILVIEINYPDCINYEGNKILLFKNCKIEDLKKQNKIDPHFSKNKKYHSPIARFEPTDDGWGMACYLASEILSI